MDVSQLVQPVQLLLHGAHVGVLIPVADVQIDIPGLADAGRDNAVAHAQHAVGGVPVAGLHMEAELVQRLAGVALRIDVGDVVARDGQALVGRVDAHLGHCKDAKSRIPRHG